MNIVNNQAVPNVIVEADQRGNANQNNYNHSNIIQYSQQIEEQLNPQQQILSHPQTHINSGVNSSMVNSRNSSVSKRGKQMTHQKKSSLGQQTTGNNRPLPFSNRMSGIISGGLQENNGGIPSANTGSNQAQLHTGS